MKTNPIAWVEIPVNDMARAVTFYNAVFGFDLQTIDLGAIVMAQFPSSHEENGCSGALVYNQEFYHPENSKGPLVYINCDSVSRILELAKSNGGHILIAEKQISPEHGYMGVMLDSEGNRIAVQANA